MGQLVQIATEFDNMGFNYWLVDKNVIEQIVKQHPRLGWSGCFSKTIEEEIAVSLSFVLSSGFDGGNAREY